jgi:hypothetical protein
LRAPNLRFIQHIVFVRAFTFGSSHIRLSFVLNPVYILPAFMYTDESFICSGCVLNPAVQGDPPKNVGSAHSLTMGCLKHKPEESVCVQEYFHDMYSAKS